MAYRAAGRTAEAIPLLERRLADCERVRGTDHPDNLTTRNNLAMAYRAAGRPNEARWSMQRSNYWASCVPVQIETEPVQQSHGTGQPDLVPNKRRRIEYPRARLHRQ